MAASPRLALKLAPWLFGFILSGLMSLLVSGLATWRALGLGPDFPAQWLSAWWPAWLLAFPAVLLLAPLTRKLVQLLLGEPAAPAPMSAATRQKTVK